MTKWRIRLLGPNDEVFTWIGYAGSNAEAEALARAEYPNSIIKSGTEIPE